MNYEGIRGLAVECSKTNNMMLWLFFKGVANHLGLLTAFKLSYAGALLANMTYEMGIGLRMIIIK